MAEFFYNVNPTSGEIYYKNPSTGGFDKCTCYQVEYKKFVTEDGNQDYRLGILVLLKDTPITLRTTQDAIFKLPNVPMPYGSYRIVHEFDLNDSVYIADTEQNAVRSGKILQVEAKVHQNLRTPSTHTGIHLTYYVKVDDSNNTITVTEDNVFGDIGDAWFRVFGIEYTPTPTPPAVTPVPTPPPGSIASNAVTVSKLNVSSAVLKAGTPVSLVINPLTGIVGVVPTKSTRVSGDNVPVNIYEFLGFVKADIPVGGSGLIITEGTINILTSQWDDIVDDSSSGGLVPGRRYYLSKSSGLITMTPPVKDVEDIVVYSKQIGIAASNDEMDIRFGHTIKL